MQLAYKGTNYNGWQRQKNATGVQQVIERALKILLKFKIQITGAGRTDTGVHASFYVAHFDTDFELYDLEKITRKVNGILPRDISIKFIKPIDEKFHSRFSAIKRTYKYFIHTEKNPFLNEFSLFYTYPIDIQKLNDASKLLLEYEDFKSFEKLHSNNKTSICKVYEAYWQQAGHRLVFTITASRFLRNMVRSIVGTLLDVGRGKLTVEDFRKIIEAKNRKYASASADAHGLFLTDIRYPDKYDKIFERETTNPFWLTQDKS